MKVLLIILGSISLALGVIGIFVPLLPTTPLLLLAAALYFRSSPKLYDWLLNHPRLGTYIRNFREHRAIPLRVKIVSVSLVWLTMGYCIIAVVEPLWLRIALALLATAITIHILSFKTLRNS
ncbi:MAG: YbaN family protein [Rikenellaceae bacterium]|nr:YbaN family protein [Rikenellaceae bacterium]